MESALNFYSVLEFNATTSKAKEGEALTILHYKERKDANGNKLGKYPSLCVSLPPVRLNLSTMPAACASVTLALWDSLRADLIRQIIETKRNKTTGENTKHSISSDEISLEAIASFAASTGNGKLSGDAIGQWFDNTLVEPMLAAIIAAKPEASDDDCQGILANFRASMMKLAAVNPGLPEADYNALRKQILRAPEGDAMADRLLLKIEAASKEKKATLADLI